MSETILNERLARLETEMKEVKATVNAIHDISTNIALMNQSLTILTNNFGELKTDVEEIREKPTKDANLVRTVMITTIASSLTTLVLSQFVL